MKYFYFVSECGEIERVALVSNPDSAIVEELGCIEEIGGWDVRFMVADIDDRQFLEDVETNNDEGAGIVLPASPITAEAYYSAILAKLEQDNDD